MPTQVVSAATMQVGKKGGGKHFTAAEVDARKKAAEAFERSEPMPIEPPIWLPEEAVEIWDKKIREIKGLNAGTELLDALDSELLAVYCDNVVKYKKLSIKKRLSVDEHKLLQAYTRALLQCSERLGFTPGARARLIKRRAEGGNEDPFSKFD